MFTFGDGPLTKMATWLAEKFADVLLGGDILSPKREGTDIDWDAVEQEQVKKPIIATIARFKVELTIEAANRKLEGRLEESAQNIALTAATELKDGEKSEAIFDDSCILIIQGVNQDLIEFKLLGSGKIFNALREEIWNRAKEVRDSEAGHQNSSIKKRPSQSHQPQSDKSKRSADF